MKKKLMVTALAVALVAIAVGGTLAWFNDTDEVTNVFTVGSVDIEQKEKGYCSRDNHPRGHHRSGDNRYH